MRSIKAKNPKKIVCPNCRVGQLIIEDLDVPGNCILQFVLPESKLKAKFYLKCSICKEQIGMRFKLSS